MTFEDPLISAIGNALDKQLGKIKLEEMEIKEVIDKVNKKDMRKLWDVGWEI